MRRCTVPTGAWLVIGIGSALAIITVLLVFVLPSSPRASRLTPRRLTLPRRETPSPSPIRSLLTGFSYLYAPLSYPHVHYSVAGRLEHAIARIDAVDPSVAPDRVGQAFSRWWIWSASQRNHRYQPKRANLLWTPLINREMRSRYD